MKKNNAVCQPKPVAVRPWTLVASLAMMVILGASCSSSRHSNSLSHPLEESFTLPPFLTGSVAALLTNTNDFSARMVVDLPAFPAKTRTITGNLLGQGSQLLFAPTVGDRSFIWDVTHNNGYVISEALQGCAPIASSAQITNILEIAGAAGPILEAVNGQPCHRVEVVVSSSDGSTARFALWRTIGANGFPAKIKSINGPTQFVITISDVRREALAQRLFLPPDGFTMFASANGMRDELQMRQKAVGKKITDDEDQNISGVGHGEPAAQIGR